MSKNPKSYQEAFEELKALSSQLESEEVNIDELSEVVKRASFLVKFCQNKLRETEESLKENDPS